MKTTAKILLPLFTAPLLLAASCSDEPSGQTSPDPGRYILFAPPALTLQSNSSRSLERSLSGDFTVYGYCAPQDIKNQADISWGNAAASWNDKSGFVTPRVFSEQRVSAEGKYALAGGGLRAWESQSPYDEKGFKYSFIAHYPAGEGVFSMNKKMADGAVAAMGVPELTFTMPFSYASPLEMLDADLVPDAMVAAVFDLQKSGTAVKFRFEHLLSSFRFMVNNYTNLRLEIKRVELIGSFYRSAKVNFKTTTPEHSVGTDMYSGTYSLLDESQFVPAQGSAGDYLGASEANNNEGVTLKLLAGLNPDKLPDYDYLGSGIMLVMDYTLYEPGSTEPVHEYTNVTTNFLPGQPKAGVRYTVNLNYLGNEFVLVFLPETDVWEGDEDNDIIIN